MSSSRILWVPPPPKTTAFLSRKRSPGAVFRVANIVTPFARSTMHLVSVAIPLILIMILSAVLSALRIALAHPDTFITAVPFPTFEPSLTRIWLLQPQISKTIDASSRPHAIADRDLQAISAQ